MTCVVTVKVIPNSGKVSFSLDSSGRFKVHLKSLPVDGKANKELLQLFAKALEIPSADISIVSGLTSRLKRLRITGPLTLNDVMSKLGFALQTTFLK
ncbi:DUF167 domain-containing protein [Candidatus Dependentiae bacterium]|nr:DUF167 domain-containing protein [Candidatus Dependentiae bacterium]